MAYHLKAAAGTSSPDSERRLREPETHVALRQVSVTGRRYYRPRMARWLNRDPIEEAGGVNIYGFARTNPLMYFDALGLSDGCCCCCVDNLSLLPDWNTILYAGPMRFVGHEFYVKADLSCHEGEGGNCDIEWWEHVVSSFPSYPANPFPFNEWYDATDYPEANLGEDYGAYLKSACPGPETLTLWDKPGESTRWWSDPSEWEDKPPDQLTTGSRTLTIHVVIKSTCDACDNPSLTLIIMQEIHVENGSLVRPMLFHVIGPM